MKNLLKQFKALFIVSFALILFFGVQTARASESLYWYSTGSTNWESVSNWYTDSDHTIQASAVPRGNLFDQVFLLGSVAPIINMDVSYDIPTGVDSTGLTGGANITGVIVESERGNYFPAQVLGNATFNKNVTSVGVLQGNIIFNNNSYPGSDIYGNATFNNNSYNPTYIEGSAVFNDNTYNSGTIVGLTTFNGHSYNYYGTVSDTATFNDFAYDYGGSYGNDTIFNQADQFFTFTGFVNNEWGNSENWNNNVVPGPDDDIYVTTCIDGTEGESGDYSIRSATFVNGACWNSGGILTATDGIFFDSGSVNYNGVDGSVVFNLSSQNYGTVTGTSQFINSSYNGDLVQGGYATFTANSYSEGALYTSGDFVNAINNGYIDGDAYFSSISSNNGEVLGVATFGYTSVNNGYVYENGATFYDETYNYGSISANAVFVGDLSDNDGGTLGDSPVRMYLRNTNTTRDFATLPWRVIADGAVVDVTAATFNVHTVFQTSNGGSFVGSGGFRGVTINSPTNGSIISTWSPSVAWHTSFNDYVTCQYSYNTINWFGASCAGDGSDLVATTTYGTQTLTVRATDQNDVATTSAVTYTFTPARILYFYNSGSDASWTTVGNWYTNSSHTIPAGAVPTPIDNVTVVGSTTPSANLDTWVQPSTIYTPVGITFTSASSASTTATVTGSATFNNTAKNKGIIIGNATFNGTSQNVSGGGRIVGNAVFNGTAINTGTVVVNATFYGDTASNTGTVSGIKTRYYTATTTTTKNFTSNWTVVADGVMVNVASSTYDGTTKFKTLNSGFFIGGPTAVYWSSNVPNAAYTNTTNWYSDSTATTHINRIASSTETVITVGSYGPLVDLDNVNWIAPAGIDASQTGITFTSAANAVLTTSVTGTTTFTNTVRNTSTILGDAIFASSTRNDPGAVISGNVIFNTTSINNGGLIAGDATFNNSAVNGTSSATISGTAYFNNTSRNDGVISNDAYFYGDSTNNNGTVSGTQKRYYTANATTTRNFVTTGPWTLVADGAVVNLTASSTFSTTTTFTELHGGDFTGDGVPGSYTTCTRPLYFAATYSLNSNVTTVCDIQVDGVTINGNGYSLGTPPAAVQPFPNNGSTSSWFNMSGNVGLFHLDGNFTDSSGNSKNGSCPSTCPTSTTGQLSGAYDFQNRLVKFPALMDFNYDKDFSISIWFKNTSDSGNWRALMGFGEGNAGGTGKFSVALTLFGNNLYQRICDEGVGCLSSSGTPFISNAWNNAVLVYHSNHQSELYLNGTLAESASFSFTTTGGTTIQNQLGGLNNVYPYFGLMDEVAVWNKTLNQTDVTNIYATQGVVSTAPSSFTTHNHSFNLSNITVNGPITSVGATINVTNATTSDITVTGADALGNAQAGGTIILTGSNTGALTANGGNSTDYGYGGAAGVITNTTSTFASKVNNAGSNGPNLGVGQSSGGSSTGVLGCTDPNATNYNSSATIYNGSCHYTSSVVRGCTNPSATNYNSNATVNDGSCSYPSYNTIDPNPSSNSGGNSNSNNDNNTPNNNPPAFSGGGGAGFTLSPEILHQLLLRGITGISTPIINNVGITNFGNVLGGLQPLGNLQLSNISIDFVPQISAFLFAPLPNSILSALNKSPELANLFASVGVSKEQDLVTIKRKPILLPKEKLPAGMFTVTSSSTPLDVYLSSGDVHSLVELVKVKPRQVITVSLEPLSKGKVLGLFMGDTISFFESSKSEYFTVIESPTIAGRYTLTTKSSPLPLVIEVVVPAPQVPVKKLTFFKKVSQWFSNLFH